MSQDTSIQVGVVIIWTKHLQWVEGYTAHAHNKSLGLAGQPVQLEVQWNKLQPMQYSFLYYAKLWDYETDCILEPLHRMQILKFVWNCQCFCILDVDTMGGSLGQPVLQWCHFTCVLECSLSFHLLTSTCKTQTSIHPSIPSCILRYTVLL